MPMHDVPEDRENPFLLCHDLDEVLLVLDRLLGLDAVDRLLSETRAANTKETLQEIAARFSAIGLMLLARLVRVHARRACPGRRTFGPGYQTKSALVVIARRRAERQLH
jgi:hypothetical protein